MHEYGVTGGSVAIITGARVDWEFICQMFLKVCDRSAPFEAILWDC